MESPLEAHSYACMITWRSIIIRMRVVLILEKSIKLLCPVDTSQALHRSPDTCAVVSTGLNFENVYRYTYIHIYEEEGHSYLRRHGSGGGFHLENQEISYLLQKSAVQKNTECSQSATPSRLNCKLTT